MAKLSEKEALEDLLKTLDMYLNFKFDGEQLEREKYLGFVKSARISYAKIISNKNDARERKKRQKEIDKISRLYKK